MTTPATTLDLTKFSAEDREIIETLVSAGAYPDAEAAVSAMMALGKAHPAIVAQLNQPNEGAVSEEYLRELVAEYDASPEDAEPVEDAFRSVREEIDAYVASKSGQ